MQPHLEHRGSQVTDALAWEIARQEARAYLEQHKEATARALGRAVEIRLEQGHPAERIIGLAREIGADLTVLGSHGEGGVTAWNLGSTVQQVLAVTRGSVLIARLSSSTPSAVIPRRILVPLDGSLRTESVSPTAARIASGFGAELLLVHVVQEPIASSVLWADDDLKLANELTVRLEYVAGHERLVWDEDVALPGGATIRQLSVGTASTSWRFAPSDASRRRAHCVEMDARMHCRMPHDGTPFELRLSRGQWFETQPHTFTLITIDGAAITARAFGVDDAGKVTLFGAP